MNANQLGLSLYFGYHDSCATFYTGEEILLHLEAERVFRRKHMRVTADEMHELIRIGQSHLQREAQSIDELLIAQWNNQFDKADFQRLSKAEPIFTGHHQNHIGSGFASGYEDAVIVCADGGSEDGTTKVYLKNGRNVHLLDDLDDTVMTGKFYGTITQMIIDPRFGRAHDTYPGKTMGLAALGELREEYWQLLEAHATEINKLHMTGCDHLRTLFGLSDDYAEPWNDKNRVDLAHTAQLFWEQNFYNKLSEYRNLSENIIFVGGCAYNVPLNSRIADNQLYKNIYVTPVSGDSGQSLGAVLFRRPGIACKYPFLGRGFGEAPRTERLRDQLVQDLLDHKIIAWYQGRSEVGARALGHRSFIGLPDSLEMRNRLSQDIKCRESYRPVAPIITAEDLHDFFCTQQESPFMSFSPLAKDITRECAPAIVHYDGTSRVQTLTQETNPVLYGAIIELKKRTGIPIIMNTSFNINGEPIVDTPEDAKNNFTNSGADVLYINGERYEA